MLFGILKSNSNTGLDSELQCVFTAPLSVISNQPSYVQDMMSLRRRASTQLVQRWEIEAGISPSNNSSEFLEHSVFNNHSTVFFVRMPQVYGMARTSGSALSAGAAQGATSLALTTPLKAGEFFQISGDKKVYMAGKPGGAGTMIVPGLAKAAAESTALVLNGNVTLHARYDESVRLGITYVDGILSNPGVVKFVESLDA